MAILLEKYNILNNSNIYSLLEKSKKATSEFKQQAFKTSTLKELITDKFEYSGSEPNVILVKDKNTGKPVKLNVFFEKIPISTDIDIENWELYRDEKLVGTKNYAIQVRPTGVKTMRVGNMHNFSNNLSGIGTRLDQLHIERALQLGINSIPRAALPQATYYHAMMGFQPITAKLVLIENNNLPEAMKKAFPYIEKFDFEPIIIQKDGNFYIDCNTTLACANLNKCRELCEQKKSKGKIKKINGEITTLALSGEELVKWKEILDKHSILKNFTFKDLK